MQHYKLQHQRESQTKKQKETVKNSENKKGKNDLKWPKRETKRNPKTSSEHREKENKNVNGGSEGVIK